MEASAFLAAAKAKIGPLYVVHGDEAFLKRQVIRALRKRALAEDDNDEAIATYTGEKALFAEVFDDLETVPFFYSRRVVIVEGADPFITKYRGELEKKLTHLPATGLLILDVKTWAANTRLAKLIDNAATIACKAPKSAELPIWCGQWCFSQYQKQLAPDAGRLLCELVDPEMGLLDQELAKLSVYIGARPRIEFADVDTLVGNNRAADVFKIFDAVAAGNIKAALASLEKLFDHGEEPMRILGAFAFQLRKLATAGRLSAQGQSVGAALAAAGVIPYFSGAAEAQMRHLGRRRLDRLYDWLLQLNMDLRGGSPLPPRVLFERFLLRLAR